MEAAAAVVLLRPLVVNSNCMHTAHEQFFCLIPQYFTMEIQTVKPLQLDPNGAITIAFHYDN